MKKLYILTDSHNNIHNLAFTNQQSAEYEKYIENDYHGHKYEVKEIELPFIGRSVCYVDAYFGFDYDYNCGRIYNVGSRSVIYACVDHAKKSILWKKYEERAKADPGNHAINDNMIASLEYGKPFTYGDVMCGMFNLTIRRIRVIKKTW